MLIHIGYNIEFELPAPAQAFFTPQGREKIPEASADEDPHD